MKVWMYMRWHSEHVMGHMWVSQESPAVGARRYGHGLTRRSTRAREKTAQQSDSGDAFLAKLCNLCDINKSGVVVMPR